MGIGTCCASLMNDLNAIPSRRMMVEGENRIHKVILGPPPPMPT